MALPKIIEDNKMTAAILAALTAGGGVTVTLNETDMVQSEEHKVVVEQLASIRASADKTCPALKDGRIALDAAIAQVPKRRQPDLQAVNDGLLSEAWQGVCSNPVAYSETL